MKIVRNNDRVFQLSLTEIVLIILFLLLMLLGIQIFFANKKIAESKVNEEKYKAIAEEASRAIRTPAGTTTINDPLALLRGVVDLKKERDHFKTLALELEDKLTTLTTLNADLDKLSRTLGLVRSYSVISDAVELQRKLIEAFQIDNSQSKKQAVLVLYEEIIKTKLAIDQIKKLVDMRFDIKSTTSSVVPFLDKITKSSNSTTVGQNDPRGLVTESIGRKIREFVPAIEVYPATGIITLPESMLFEINSSVLSPRGISAVNQLAAQLEKILPCYVSKPQVLCAENPQKSEIDTIFVEGHTDSRPLISETYDNTNLSFDRARSVYKLLAQRKDKIDLLKFKNHNEQQLFSMSGYADTRPVPGENGLSDKNRRVDLRIVLAYKKGDSNSSISETISAIKKSTK
jgi:chemotaxis protein MotB